MMCMIPRIGALKELSTLKHMNSNVNDVFSDSGADLLVSAVFIIPVRR